MRRWVSGGIVRLCLVVILVTAGIVIGGTAGIPVALADSLVLSPSNGPPGTHVGITWVDNDGLVTDHPSINDVVYFDSTPIATFTTDAHEGFTGTITIPTYATAGIHAISVSEQVVGDDSDVPTSASFIVIGTAPCGKVLGQQCAAIWTDRGTYQAGDAATVCYSTPIAAQVTITEAVPGGVTSTVFQGQDNGTGGCFALQALPPFGTHTLTLSIAGGNPNAFVLVASTSFSVVPNNAPPAGLWVSPLDNALASLFVHLEATAYPGTVYSYPVARVDFTAWWPGVGLETDPWKVVCSVSATSAPHTYTCDVNLSALGAPAGPVMLGFNVYDTAGHERINPNLTRTIMYLPPGPAAPSPTAIPTATHVPPTATPTATPIPTASPTATAVAEFPSTVSLFAPFDRCATKKSHHASPAKHALAVLTSGFSAASASCHATTGTFGLRVVAFGGKAAGKAVRQQATSSGAIVARFTPGFTGSLAVKVKLTLHGKAGSASGNGLAARVRYRDGLGRSLLDWLTQAQLRNLLSSVRHQARTTTAHTAVTVFLRISGGAAGSMQRKLPAPTTSYPLPPSSAGRSFGGRTETLSTVVSVTAGKSITVTVGASAQARSGGASASIVRLKNCKLNVITLTKR